MLLLAVPGAALANDSFGSAFAVPLNTTWTQSTAGATEDGEPLAGCPMAKTVWYRITGNGGPIRLSTLLSQYDTALAVFETAGAPAEENRVACDNDGGVAQVELASKADQPYLVQLGGAGAASGALQFTALANDERTGAETVAPGGQVDRTNVTATRGDAEARDCNGTEFARTVWFRFSVGGPGRVTATASGGQLAVALYRGAEASPIACSTSGRLEADVPAGDYFVQVGSVGTPDTATQGGLRYRLEFAPDTDLDDDGSPTGQDCDDANAAVHPGAAEVPNNDVDENCDGARASDRDNDGGLDEVDCAPDDARRYVGATEVIENGLDENCDGIDPIFADIGARILATWKPFKRRTKLVGLTVTNVPAGTAMEIRCIGRRCPFRRLRGRFTRTTARYGAGKLLRGRTRFPIDARLEVKLTKPGSSGRVRRWRMRPNRRPKTVDYCIQRGVRVRCPA